jgi:hypothetical protein
MSESKQAIGEMLSLVNPIESVSPDCALEDVVEYFSNRNILPLSLPWWRTADLRCPESIPFYGYYLKRYARIVR